MNDHFKLDDIIKALHALVAKRTQDSPPLALAEIQEAA